MKILYVCHRFPFPPKRGGKIRPFNMIRHLGRTHEVTVVSLVRSAAEADEGRGIAPYCHRFEMARVGAPLQALRMVARLPTTTPSSFGYFRSAAMASTIDRLLAEQAFDLVFVHCSSVARYVEHARGMPKILDFGDMDSQKWLEYGAFKPWPMSVGYRLEGHKLVAEEKRLARAFDLCTTTTRAEWETLQGYATGAATDWFPNGVDSDYFAPDETAYDADTLSFRRAHGLLPEPGLHVRFLPHDVPPHPRRAPAGATRHRRRRPQPGRACARHATRRDGDRIGARRARAPAALGGDGGAVAHRARHAEQDPGGDGGGRAGGHEQRRRGRVSMPAPARTSWWPTVPRRSPPRCCA